MNTDTKRRMSLWHPQSPGIRMNVTVSWWRWPFRRWLEFATISEVLHEYRQRLGAPR